MISHYTPLQLSTINTDTSPIGSLRACTSPPHVSLTATTGVYQHRCYSHILTYHTHPSIHPSIHTSFHIISFHPSIHPSVSFPYSRRNNLPTQSWLTQWMVSLTAISTITPPLILHHHTPSHTPSPHPLSYSISTHLINPVDGAANGYIRGLHRPSGVPAVRLPGPKISPQPPACHQKQCQYYNNKTNSNH